MSKLTEFLQLFEYDPAEDKVLPFNITHALNENWDKVDAWAKAQSESGIPITIPGGWMLGDVNHDGKIDEDDRQMVLKYAIAPLTGMAKTAADINKDGNINTNDANQINLIRKGLAFSEDLLGNWVVDTDTGLFYVDIPVDGMQSGDVVDIYVPDGTALQNCRTLQGECLAGVLRITCYRIPVADVAAYIKPGMTEHVRFLTDIDVLKKYKDTKAHTIVVGTETAGHTAYDCDYLCTGEHDELVINDAISQLTAGGEVHLLAGTYHIADDGIRLNSSNGITLSGEGAGTILDGTDMSATTSNGVIVINKNNCSVKDLSLIGNAFLTIYPNGIRVMARMINTKILDVDIAYCDAGIFLPYSTSGTRNECIIRSCNIAYCYTGIDMGGKNCVVEGNVLRENRDTHISVTGSGNLVVNNLVMGHEVLDSGENNTVINNKSE